MAEYDPRGRRNRAVLIGIDSYEHMAAMPGIQHNLTELRKALTAPGTGVFRDRHVVIEQPRMPHEFMDAVREAEKAANGILLLYFAGHGRVHADGSHFTFMVGESFEKRADRAAPYRNSVSWALDVLPWLRDARADRVVVILDCCHAGNAAQEFDAGDRKPMYLLSAVQANHEIPSGDGSGCTPFTAELVRLLNEGLPDNKQDDNVTIGGLAHALVQSMERQTTVWGEVWRPQYVLAHAHDDVLLSLAPLDVADLRIPLPVQVRTLWEDFKHWLRKFRTRILTVAAVLAVVAAGVTVPVVIAGTAPACPTPLELRLLTDAETQQTLAKAVEAYTGSDANRAPLSGRGGSSEGCRQVNVTVYSAPAGSVVEGFQHAGAWVDPPDGCREETAATAAAATTGSAAKCFSPVLDVGPQPDIWIPASTTDVSRARNEGGAVSFTGGTPLAYSPVVVAVHDSLRSKLEAAGRGRTGTTIDQLVTTLRDKSADVQRPDPETDTAALLATAGLYRDDSGKQISTSDLSGLERYLVALGSARDTDADLLCQLAAHTTMDQNTAVIVSEHSLAQFNRTDVGKPDCVDWTPAPRTAYYPSDVPALDHPFVHVAWAGAGKDVERRADAVDRLHTWLQSAAGQKFFTDEGYRGADTEGHAQTPPPGSLLSMDSDATQAGALGAQDIPTADELNYDIGLYRAARGAAKVLFVLDDSPSMRDHWGIARSALQKSISALGPKDDFGILVTSGTQLAELGGGAEHDTAVRKRLAALNPVAHGQADIVSALGDALGRLSDAGASDQTPGLVVLITDDKAEKQITKAKGDGLVDDVRAARADHRITTVVVSLVVNGCKGNKLDTQLAEASRGVCLDRSADLGKKLPEEVAKVGTGETP